MSARQRRRGTAVRNSSTEDLFESQMQLQATALEIAANGIVITDAAGKILWVNSAFTRLTGFGAAEAHGNTPRLLKSGLHDRPFYEELWNTIVAGQSWRGEFINRRKDGTIFYSEQTITPVCDAESRITHFVGIMTDVTERKNAEQILRRQALTFENLYNAVLFIDKDGTIADVNPSGTRTFGYERQELIGQHVGILNASGDGPGSFLAIQTAVAAHGRWEGEIEFVRKDGTRGVAELAVVPLRDAAGAEISRIGVCRDVTEKKRVELALRESEARYKQLFEHAFHGIYRSLPDGTIVDANPALVSMLGYRTRDELFARNLNNDVYVSAADRAAILAHYAKGNPRERFEATWKRADGTPIYVRLAGRKVDGLDSRPSHYDVVVEDVTEHHQLQERLSHAAKMEAVGRLAGGVAHDFNNLMGVVLGFGDMLLFDGDLTERSRKRVEEMRKAANRAVEVTRQLLAFSRKQVLESRIVSLNDVVRETGKMLRRLIGEDIELKTVLDPDLAAINADPTQLDQILLNLAVNARDAMPNGGTLTIETANTSLTGGYEGRHLTMPTGEYVMLAVSDTGHGIKPEVKEHIFEPFFTTKKERGTGLGLSTVYGIVKQSGGYIWVYSEVGHGTTFKIYLPQVEGCPVETTRSAPTEFVSLGHETILLVEDDASLRALTDEMLRNLGYMVLTAANAAEALNIVQRLKGPLDLVISDVILPGMNGGQLVTALRKMRPLMKVLFVSGYTDNVIHDALSAGAAFLQKPICRDALARKVREVLSVDRGCSDGMVENSSAGGLA